MVEREGNIYVYGYLKRIRGIAMTFVQNKKNQ